MIELREVMNLIRNPLPAKWRNSSAVVVLSQGKVCSQITSAEGAAEAARLKELMDDPVAK